MTTKEHNKATVRAVFALLIFTFFSIGLAVYSCSSVYHDAIASERNGYVR